MHLSRDVDMKLGGTRDKIMRVYGIGIAILAVSVELDIKGVIRHMGGLKPFLIRSMMLLYVATVSGTSPMIRYEARQSRNNRYANYNGDDNANDAYNQYNKYNQANYIRDEVPGSIVAFQSMTSFFM